MDKKALLTTVILMLSACATVNDYELTKTQRADGAYGAWTTTTQTNVFGSARFSYTYGKVIQSTRPTSLKPRLIVQDDFSLRIETGDSFICGISGIGFDYVLEKDGLANDIGRSIWVLDDSRLFIRLNKGDLLLDKWRFGAWIHAFNLYDKATIRYTDDCGQTLIMEFDISGDTHLRSEEIPRG